MCKKRERNRQAKQRDRERKNEGGREQVLQLNYKVFHDPRALSLEPSHVRRVLQSARAQLLFRCCCCVGDREIADRRSAGAE